MSKENKELINVINKINDNDICFIEEYFGIKLKLHQKIFLKIISKYENIKLNTKRRNYYK